MRRRLIDVALLLGCTIAAAGCGAPTIETQQNLQPAPLPEMAPGDKTATLTQTAR